MNKQEKAIAAIENLRATSDFTMSTGDMYQAIFLAGLMLAAILAIALLAD